MATTAILRPRQAWAFNSTKRKLPLCSEQTFCLYHLEHGSLNPSSKSRKMILSNSPQGRFLGCRNHSLIISPCTCWIWASRWVSLEIIGIFVAPLATKDKMALHKNGLDWCLKHSGFCLYLACPSGSYRLGWRGGKSTLDSLFTYPGTIAAYLGHGRHYTRWGELGVNHDQDRSLLMEMYPWGERHSRTRRRSMQSWECRVASVSGV